MIYGFNDAKEKIDLLNYIYPVGTVYETADASFDPNTAWGGTWVEISGKFLLASSSSHAVGQTGGAETKSYTPSGTVGGHTLTVQEIPAHKHSVSVPTTTVSITEGEQGLTENVPKVGVATNTSEVGGGQSHNHGFTGAESNINVMPPYEVVKIWKRTA